MDILINKKSSGELITQFKFLFNEYNQHGFLDQNIVILKTYKKSAMECIALFNYLKQRGYDLESLNYFHRSSHLIYLRLKCLVDFGRKETSSELSGFLSKEGA